MAYLVQVWRGVPPQCGGLGWVTYGGPVSEARAHQLLALSQRIRPQHPHKLETITPRLIRGSFYVTQLYVFSPVAGLVK